MISAENERRVARYYRKMFPHQDVDRTEMMCPECGVGENNFGAGGSEVCFHCTNCGLCECEVTSPVFFDED